jgi:co-chaperonin GroES (HSP10)
MAKVKLSIQPLADRVVVKAAEAEQKQNQELLFQILQKKNHKKVK